MRHGLIRIGTHLFACVLGIAGVLGYQSVHRRALMPGIRTALSRELDIRAEVLAASGRLVLIAFNPSSTISERQYWLYDQIAREHLASFSEGAADRPLLTRVLYRPGPLPQSAVAAIGLDEVDYNLRYVALSPADAGPDGQQVRETIYDDNLDGVCDRILEGPTSPHRTLVRLSETQWAEMRAVMDISEKDTGDREVLLGNEWSRARQGDDGFWHPIPGKKGGHCTLLENQNVPFRSCGRWRWDGRGRRRRPPPGGRNRVRIRENR